MKRLLTAGLLTLFALTGLSAADTTWTRTFFRGQQCVPAHVRCTNWTTYVTVGVSDNGTIKCVLLSYDVTGDVRWMRDINQHMYDLPSALAVDPDGYPVVAISADTMPQFSYIVRCNPGGDTVWTRTLLNSVPRALALGRDGSVYVLGHRFPSYQDSLWLAKLDRYGNLIWSRMHKVATTHTINGLGADRFGNLRAALSVTQGSEKPMLVKFTNDGDLAWSKVPTNIGTELYSLAVDSTGACYATSSTRIVKFDTAGSRAWSVAVPSRAARDIAIDEDGVYVAFADVGYDYNIRMYTLAGSQVRTVKFARPSLDSPISLAVGHGQHVYVTGTAQEGSTLKALTADFEPLSNSVVVEEPPAHVPVRRAPAAILRGGRLRWHAPRNGTYTFAIHDAAGALLGPRLRVELTAGEHDIQLPAAGTGIGFLSVSGPGGTVACSRLLRLAAR